MDYADSMAEREPHNTGQLEPENGEKTREVDWIEENRPLFYAMSAVAAEQIGRGVLLVDTTTQLPHGGHPISYQLEEEIAADDTRQNLLQAYNPQREFILTLLKPEGQTSTYLERRPEMGWWRSIESISALAEQEPAREIEIPKALFDLGQVVITIGADAESKNIGRHPIQLIARHIEGDWGNLPPEDIQENQLSLEKGYRIFSAYDIEGSKFYVITEWDRSATTVLLPREY